MTSISSISSRIPAFALLLLLAVGGTICTAGNKIDWKRNLKEGTKISRSTGQPIAVDVWAIWCGPCKQMEQSTFPDPDVIEAFTGLVPVRVDADVDRAFVARYGVDAYPTILFLDEDRNELTRLLGYVSPSELSRVIEAVQTGYGNYLANRNNESDMTAQLEAGNYLLGLHNPRGADDYYKRVARSAPDAMHTELARLGLVRCQLRSGRTKAGMKKLRKLVTEAENDEVKQEAAALLASRGG